MRNPDSPQFQNWRRRQIQRYKLLLDVTHVNKISVYSASACYFMVLAAFPMLVLVLSILRYTPLELETLIELLDGLLPVALHTAVNKVIISTYENSSTALLSVSVVVALWSASRSVYGLVIGLNAIYGVKENRNYFHIRGMNMLYMLREIIEDIMNQIMKKNTYQKYMN